MAGEKTEKATPKKRRDERKKGNIFQSKDIVTAAFLLIVFYALRLLSPIILNLLTEYIRETVVSSQGGPALTDSSVTEIFKLGLVTLGMTTLPLLLISSATTVIFTGAQTGFLFSGDVIKFKMSRLNPLEGIKKMFSLRSIAETLKSLLKIIIIGYVLYSQFINRMLEFPKLMNYDMLQSLAYIGNAVASTIVVIGGLFIFLGLIDYFYQWWEHEKQMRMSKDEIKQEYKQLEGDPQLKGKIKEKQRQMSQQRMMQQVPTSDVVIRNPTHFAVALKYDPKLSPAPIVVALGQDNIALKIISVAEQNGITCIENRPLARSMYDACKLGEDIPVEFFVPVAEILATVYSLAGKSVPVS